MELFLVFCLIAAAFADTPANCTYGDVEGLWKFYVGEGGNDRTLDCSDFTKDKAQDTLMVKLLYPDLAFDTYGNKGFWTLIYNQGIEVVISGRKFFAFSKYEKNGTQVTSVCDQTMPGWSHDIFDRNWACFIGSKNDNMRPKIHKETIPSLAGWRYRANSSLVEDINRSTKLWKAAVYPHFENMDVEDMIRMAGGRKSTIPNKPSPAKVTREQAIEAASLPDNFDWRDVDGVNYVSPIRNQGSCGSCYAFSAMGMNEARVRVMTNNTQTPVFSPQDVVECSEYSQGCDGGFPYLIGGKYAEDFGLVQEECNPYKGKDGSCSTLTSCPRFYSTKYEYVGGFYGACNDQLMKINLFKYGPIAVAFEVYDDFFHYKSGVYHHTGIEDKFNPFEITNHAVLLVGYGTDTSDPSNPQDYWLVKNSWGPTWGLDGYFKISRGNDECSIESIAVQSFPVL